MKDYMLNPMSEQVVLHHIRKYGSWSGYVVPERVVPLPYAKGTMAERVTFTIHSFQEERYQLQGHEIWSASEYARTINFYKERRCNERVGENVMFYSEVRF